MKRSLLAVPAAAAIMLTLSSCAGPAASEDPSLTVWVDATREPAAQAYAASVKGEVDVKIEVVDINEVISKIALFNTTGKGWPDVVFAQPNDVAALSDAANGFAADLGDLVDDKIIDGYAGANDWCEIDGKLLCLKNDLAQSVLWYDATLFDELGLTPPATMDEFAEVATQLGDQGYSSGAIGDQNFYGSYLWPSGCPMSSVVDSSTVKIVVDAPECTRVSDLVQPLVDAGALDPRSSFDAGFIADIAKQGKVAMTLGPSWFGEFVIRPETSWAIPAGRIAAAPMPVWSGEDEAYSGEWGGATWIVSSHSAFPQAAADAAVFMATDSGVATDAVTFPAYGPANEAWADRVSADDYYASDIVPALTAQSLLVRDSEKPVRFDNWAQIGAVLQTEINGGTSVADAVSDFQKSLIELASGTGYTVVKK